MGCATKINQVFLRICCEACETLQYLPNFLRKLCTCLHFLILLFYVSSASIPGQFWGRLLLSILDHGIASYMLWSHPHLSPQRCDKAYHPWLVQHIHICHVSITCCELLLQLWTHVDSIEVLSTVSHSKVTSMELQEMPTPQSPKQPKQPKLLWRLGASVGAKAGLGPMAAARFPEESLVFKDSLRRSKIIFFK